MTDPRITKCCLRYAGSGKEEGGKRCVETDRRYGKGDKIAEEIENLEYRMK